MKSSKVLARVASAAVLSIVAPVSLAQDDPLIEEITVTAAKREQSIYEVPIAASAFEGENLAKQGIADIGKFDIAYHSPDGDWTAAVYGRNVTDEEYDNARLNVTDYVLVMLNNDPSEFGARFTKRF